MRLLVYLIVGYLLWKLFQAVIRVLMSSQQPRRRPQTPPPAPPPSKKADFRDIQDAEFEDITPDKPPEA